MIPYQCIATQCDCYRTRRTITPKGVMVHSTGADNPTLKRYVQPSKDDPNAIELKALIGQNIYNNDWNRSGINAQVHAFIGKLADGSVAAVQTLPWNYRGWHAGTGTTGKSANDTHISFEICEDGLTDRDYFIKVYNEAVELTAQLCEEFRLDPLEDGVVICHNEGYTRGIASGHVDVVHWFPIHGKTMDDFRQDVAKKMKGEDAAMTTPGQQQQTTGPVIYRKLENVPAYFKPTIQKLVDSGDLKGTTEDGVLNLSYDVCRVLTILDRRGKL